MGLFESYAASDSNARFLKAFETLAGAAKTAAEAYAKRAEQPTVVVNVNYEPGVLNINDVAKAVTNAVKQGRPQDR